ncbi:MAG: GntR family transcriptional regulator [Bombilactobacillus mellifer]|uniref:GntR family transcriptional regulator n=1 Tax=Bombilactobacillus mellifer TaxID=1218492 RepID=UPI0018DD39CC|nr:GntR family transcriptional regulator [Bombilactobacillus mellifer]MBH9990808.1 GntR family transcriptional regulator [Lactobacillus sp. W8092]MCT6825793.1 GntR family transcriptional regulator [Bombilactobacillus mellifer]MCT6844172.1 GntR family transcriptional regulator [Bombilactobacillus mellifer]MCT6894935.1 GntR family transcriptional regulator [Bombilactobacillus mellifer]
MKRDYLIIKETIKKEITFGHFKVNQQLPTENELIEHFKVSRYAVRKALTELQNEHLIYKIQGSGMFIQDWDKKWQVNPRSKTIGLICTHIANYIFPQIISQIDAVIDPKGYSLLIANTHNYPQKERSNLIKLLDLQVAGLIVEPSESAKPCQNADIYQRIAKSKIPILFINAKYPEFDFPAITNADRLAEKELITYLLHQGHRKILGIFQIDDLQGTERMKGFIQAYQDNNINLANSNLIMYSSHDAFTVISNKIDVYLHSNQRPTAIACYHDELAILVIDKLKKQHIRIPQDISVVGFDNYEAATYLTPSLTTMNYQRTTVGQEAGKGILALINGQKFASIEHHPQLKLRNSVASLTK